ncbi:hypothetical protein P6B95_28430 [Streptomyces atratus]|uniref:hypothetical protein n=1 Tax=Streptomyces atratus TaxID=1893 RepID=UPI001670EB0E|nr:hypothetical protein [Streptomyces atratus]WPW30918.1 hypothetical protein P6B95_28430 [Streptomyces atratus]GGT17158.1 hypothetical protein GCM10010207_15480 [Streptomyces atratus]
MRHESQWPPEAPETPELAALLAAARRTGALDPGDEKRATAAFVAARDEGAHAAVVRWRRRRDDWRPAERRRGGRSFRVMLGGFVAVTMLGGVAAAAGSGAIPAPFGGGKPHGAESARPAYTTSATPGGRPSGEESLLTDAGGTAPASTNAPGDGRPSGRPDRTQGDAALCRVYLGDRGSGKAKDATAFERLEAAAGDASEAAVTAYCDGLLGQPSPGESKKARGNRDAKGEAEKKAVPEGKQGGRAPSKGSGNPTGSDGKDRTAVD